MTEQNQGCVAYAQGLAHPNERALANAILAGTPDEKISEEQGFDQKQIDTMRARLSNAGCEFAGVEVEDARPDGNTAGEDVKPTEPEAPKAPEATPQAGAETQATQPATETPAGDTGAKVEGQPQA